MESSGLGGVPNGAHGTGYMHPLLVLGLYMHLGMCCRTVYNYSVICIVVLMPLHARICISGWFSAVIDVLADYLTSFHNMPLQACLTSNELRRWTCLLGDTGFVSISAGLLSVGI